MKASCALVAVLLVQIAMLVVGVEQQCAAVPGPAVPSAGGMHADCACRKTTCVLRHSTQTRSLSALVAVLLVQVAVLVVVVREQCTAVQAPAMPECRSAAAGAREQGNMPCVQVATSVWPLK